ncbi:unnamed protein product [Vicia faba]|uniref:Uncharacterized protein n=1 Tax=Vicia faba TaxID=3906 RepID=A0AAV0ZPA4_VICFA|nr:unnamed protein product [Vicia faba]
MACVNENDWKVLSNGAAAAAAENNINKYHSESGWVRWRKSWWNCMNPPRKQRMRLPMQIARTKKADALMRSSSSRNFLLIIKFSLIPRHGYWTVNESWYRFEIFLKMDTGIVTKVGRRQMLLSLSNLDFMFYDECDLW